jgi:hypothetical protein
MQVQRLIRVSCLRKGNFYSFDEFRQDVSFEVDQIHELWAKLRLDALKKVLSLLVNLLSIDLLKIVLLLPPSTWAQSLLVKLFNCILKNLIFINFVAVETFIILLYSTLGKPFHRCLCFKFSLSILIEKILSHHTLLQLKELILPLASCSWLLKE